MPIFNIPGPDATSRLAVHLLNAAGLTDDKLEAGYDVEVDIRAGAFQAKVRPAYFLEDLLRLYEMFEELYSNLSGSVAFQTVEGQLKFVIVGDGRGHFHLRGTAVDNWESENELRFHFAFDQTYIPGMLQELGEIKRSLAA